MNCADFESEFEQEHIQRIKRLVGGYNININGDPRSGIITRIMLRASETLAREIKNFRIRHPQASYNGAFYRANASLEKQIAATLKAMSMELTNSIQDAMIGAWQLGNEKYDGIVEKYEKGEKIPRALSASMHQLNVTAMDAYISRKINGMNLSSRVWNYIEPNKELLEQYIGSGITIGRSAQKISLDIRDLLNEPKKLFHRVRNESGKLVLSKAAKAYHPGSGTYRSSFKNAMRLAITETNMAYRMAEVERRRQLPFVIGIIVNLSKSHPAPDICDSMAGEYPTNFVFTGWHPHCLCYTTTKLLDKYEFVDYIKTGKINQSKYVSTIPNTALSYITKRLPKIAKMEHKPYWFKENFTLEGSVRQAVIG